MAQTKNRVTREEDGLTRIREWTTTPEFSGGGTTIATIFGSTADMSCTPDPTGDCEDNITPYLYLVPTMCPECFQTRSVTGQCGGCY